MCRVTKLTTEFPTRKRPSGGTYPKPYCYPCETIYKNKYYHRTKHLQKDRLHRNRKNTIKRRYVFLFEYLKHHPCVDCGESDPIVLEFDHRKSSTKVDSVSELMRNAPMEAVKKEIKKCDVRCANCHRRKTAKDFKWYEFKGASI